MNRTLDNKENLNTVNNILNCAKNEFLEKGFKDASLRNIAKKAGVTTGAIYGYFKDKDDIFVSLVKNVLTGFYSLIEEVERADSVKYNENIELKNLLFNSKESHIKYIDYIYDNFDICKLIIVCSNGSSLENYMDNLLEKILRENKASIRLIKETSEVDEFTIHVIVEFYIRTITEFVKHDIPYQIAIKQFDNISTFFFAGWNRLMK